MRVKTLCLIFSVALVASQLASCAGGTRGSGVGSIEGRVLYLDGAAVPNVAIDAIDLNGAQDVTDANGSFVINFDEALETQNLPAIITLQLDGQQIFATVNVTAPDENSDVIVAITIDPQSNAVSQVAEAVEPRPTPTPAPTRTRAPGPTGAPTAIPTSPTTRTPGAPGPTPTIRATSTIEGSATATPTARATTVPTRTVSPTNTPFPSRTPTPTRTPR